MIEFGFRIMWRIMEISEGVIRLGLRPWRITPSSISIILHKILSLIYQLLNNRLLMTKFGRILRLMNRWRSKCSFLAGFNNAPLTEKTWGRGWFVFVAKQKWRTFHSFQEYQLGEKIAKNMVRTARRQLEGRHLLSGEYLRSWTNLNVHYRRWT